VTREERPHASIAHNLEHPPHARDHALAILNLIKDSLLHVVNEERQAVRAAHLGERARNLQAMQPIHAEHRTDPRPLERRVTMRTTRRDHSLPFQRESHQASKSTLPRFRNVGKEQRVDPGAGHP